MRHEDVLATVLRADACRWRLLGRVGGLGLPDAWVGAGFVRAAVWDHLHGRHPAPPGGDVDVAWFDPARTDPAVDRAIEAELRRVGPDVDWSVKNQARMHIRNGDLPYRSAFDALSRWPETATAIGVRRTGGDQLEVCAPFGLDDLFDLVVRPTPAFAGPRASVVDARAAAKGWFVRWPRLHAVGPPADRGATTRT